MAQRVSAPCQTYGRLPDLAWEPFRQAEKKIKVSGYLDIFGCGCAYPLVVQILVVSLDAESPLHLLDSKAMLEYLTVQGHLFPSAMLSLLGEVQQLTGMLELCSELLELLCCLSVSAAGLAGLADFTTTEAHVRITFIGIGIPLEFQGRHQGMVLGCYPPRLPMVVNVLGKVAGSVADGLVKGCFHLTIG
jgi:hypothetical protein